MTSNFSSRLAPESNHAFSEAGESAEPRKPHAASVSYGCKRELRPHLNH